MAKARKLNAKQEAFCQAYVKAGDKRGALSGAYRKAYGSKMGADAVASNAKRLMKATPIRLRIAQLQDRAEDPPHGPGRPSEFRAEFCEQATALCKLGATDKEMAAFFGVTEQTVNNWKGEHPEFFEAIRAGKIVADMEVAGKLHDRATGFDYMEATPIKLKEVQFGADGKKTAEVERVEIVQVRKVVPPETPAIAMWLTNRQKDKWKHRVTSEVTGEGGGAVKVEDVTPKHPGHDHMEDMAERFLGGLAKHAPSAAEALVAGMAASAAGTSAGGKAPNRTAKP